MSKRIAFHTLGCKLNFSETSTIARKAEEAGFVKVDFKDQSDFYIINTCSVTENADKECRYLVRKLKKQAPESRVVIIGCYAQLKPKEIASIPGVDAVLGASEKFNLIENLKRLDKQEVLVSSCEIEDVDFFTNAYSFGDRTRAFLKVQDGCDYNCSFCTIPLARGKSRSDSIENIITSAKEIAETEVKEVVLTGVNIGDFGHSNNPQKETFLDLIQALDEIEGIERFRISSIEPNLLKDEIIEFVASSKRFVPHFHIPLQSGSNEILKLMRRRYKRELYVDRVNKIKSIMPDCCIGVDVIVGFPGETEEHFKETYDFLNQLDVSYLHVFTYSERDNTHALTLGKVVPINVRKERSKMLRILSEKKRRAFYEKFIGQKKTVLFESEEKEGFISGFTDNYIKAKTSFQEKYINQLKELTLKSLDADGIMQIDNSISISKATLTK